MSNSDEAVDVAELLQTFDFSSIEWPDTPWQPILKLSCAADDSVAEHNVAVCLGRDYDALVAQLAGAQAEITRLRSLKAGDMPAIVTEDMLDEVCTYLGKPGQSDREYVRSRLQAALDAPIPKQVTAGFMTAGMHGRPL